MSLKDAVLFAMIGTILVTLLSIVDLIGDVLGVARGVIPAMRLLPSLIYAFAAVSVTVKA